MSNISSTTTAYGTVINKFLDTDGNFPVLRRKYIPSEGSKFHKVGIESITKFRSPHPSYDNMYSVIRDGKRNNYSLQELKKLFKELNIQNLTGHSRKVTFGSSMKQMISLLKK